MIQDAKAGETLQVIGPQGEIVAELDIKKCRRQAVTVECAEEKWGVKLLRKVEKKPKVRHRRFAPKPDEGV